MHESTKRVFKKHGWRVDRAIHNYVYFAYYYPYVKTVYHGLRFLTGYLAWFKPLAAVARAAFNRYHAKVLSFGDARKILTLDRDVSSVSAENKRIVPYKYAYRIIFQEPEFIAVMDCPCKKTLKDEDWTINSCIAVGRLLAEFWLDHGKKYNSRKITQKEALALVKKFRRNGYVTQSFFKVATGGSTGVICNCHPKSCVSLQATALTRRINKDLSMQAESGYVVDHDPGKCTLCGRCAEVCHFGAVGFLPGYTSRQDPRDRTYRQDRCMGCGLCVEHCPAGALSVHVDEVNEHFYPDPAKSIPLDIDLLKKKTGGA